MTANTTERYLIGYRVNEEDDENLCLACHAAYPVPFAGTVSRDREGYAYLEDEDGEFELQECVSCRKCGEILASGAILISEDATPVTVTMTAGEWAEVGHCLQLAHDAIGTHGEFQESDEETYYAGTIAAAIAVIGDAVNEVRN
jgi:hypothetical protein